MSTEVLERAFGKMGARVKVDEEQRLWMRGNGLLRLNVLRDKNGEYFDVWNPGQAELVVLDVQPKDRHMLLMSREGKEKHRYLLGHDERHWFVAGIPESAPVSSVARAKEALKPALVQHVEQGLRAGKRNRRHNAARIRQGEWFFVPQPGKIVDVRLVLRNEPMRRGRGKPHMVDELYRESGTTVYVARGYDNGLTQAEYDALDKQVRERRNWQMMKRDPTVWVRGKVRHADHATVTLNGWHRVVSNTENLSYAMRNIAFLD